MIVTETKTYCDRCKQEVIYPVESERKLYLSGIGREGGYDLCDSCYEELRSWFIGKEVKDESKECISREEAIRVAEQGQIQGYEWQFKKLCILPSVTPQPKIGHWEYVQYDSNPNIGNWHCSECRGICTEMHSIEDAYNYCPNCGAKMEVNADV